MEKLGLEILPENLKNRFKEKCIFMTIIKIVFLCHFSNSKVRDNLELKCLGIRNLINKLRGFPSLSYDDMAIWVSDYIQEFEKHPEYEFHIVAPHKGMKKEFQSFEINSINYHFFKCDNNIISDWYNSRLSIEEKNNYKKNRTRINKIITGIHPDLVMLCGAENPYYSLGVLDINKTPVYVILQTLLNSPKRIEMGVGTPYRRKIEVDVLTHAHYFCASGEKTINKIQEFNPHAVMLPAKFPTHRPLIEKCETKDYDFVFFSRGISVEKGIEDLLKAMKIVAKKNERVSLNVIGACGSDYRKHLDAMIASLGIAQNVHFSGFYDRIDDMYANVLKAKAVVVPGITAGLNSTVREAMFMGLPTICYQTSSTDVINKEKICLLTASMGDIEDLAKQMFFTIDNPDRAIEIAANGKDYAEKEFGNKAIVDKLLDNCRLIIEGKV